MSNRPKNITRLTKAQLLQGRNYTEHVYIEALGAEVAIRVLTSGEIERIKALPARGMKIGFTELERARDTGGEPDASFDMDMEKLFLAQSDAKFLTVACGLSVPGDEPWTVEDAEAITPSEAVDQIAKEVWRISGVDENDLDVLAGFRK